MIEEVNVTLYLILIDLSLNSHMGPVATEFNGTVFIDGPTLRQL